MTLVKLLGRSLHSVSSAIPVSCSLPHCMNSKKTPPVAISDVPTVPDSSWRALQSFEIPKAVHLSAEEWTPENGMLTPTFKIKREIVKRKFEAELEALYQQLKKKGFGKKPAANTIDVHSRTT